LRHFGETPRKQKNQAGIRPAASDGLSRYWYLRQETPAVLSVDFAALLPIFSPEPLDCGAKW
jgi:hypothetical protein